MTEKRPGWTLAVIPEAGSEVRQFRVTRRTVFLIAAFIAMLTLYAAVETMLFWSVARKASDVEPLRKTVRELESSSSELAQMGQDFAEVLRLQLGVVEHFAEIAAALLDHRRKQFFL